MIQNAEPGGVLAQRLAHARKYNHDGTIDDPVDLFKVGFVPIVKRSPGFVAYHLIPRATIPS
jgi:hypothetical protein